MEKLYRYFPLSACVESGNVKNLVLSLVIYLLVCAVLGVLQLVLGWIPLVGGLIQLCCYLLGLYGVAGMVLAVFRFLQT